MVLETLGYNRGLHYITLYRDPSNGDITRPRPLSVADDRNTYLLAPLICAAHRERNVPSYTNRASLG